MNLTPRVETRLAHLHARPPKAASVAAIMVRGSWAASKRWLGYAGIRGAGQTICPRGAYRFSGLPQHPNSKSFQENDLCERGHLDLS